MKIDYKNKLVATLSDTTKNIKKLCRDLRTCFEPNTNTKLNEPRSTKLRDFLSVRDDYKISHYIFITQSTHGAYLKIFNSLEKGPSYTFKIESYVLAEQLKKILPKSFLPEHSIINKTDPYILFDKSINVKFMNTHNEFPDRIVQVSKIDNFYYLRHYYIKKNDAENTRVRTVEIGPRIKMELYKIESGILEGDVIFNKYVSKTKEEVEELKKRIKERKELKNKRRQEQNENVARKKSMLLKTDNN